MPSRSPKIGMFVPLMALIGLFALMIGLGMWRTANEANRADDSRSSQAIDASMGALVDRVTGMAVDYGYWDDLARAVYSPRPDEGFLFRTVAVPTEDGTNYDRAYIVDRDGRTLWAFARGVAVKGIPSQRYGQVFQSIRSADLSARNGVGSVVQTPEGVSILGAADITPTDPALGSMVPANGPYRLVMGRRLKPQHLAKMAESLAIGRIHLGAPRGDERSLDLKAIDGTHIDTLSWKPSSPGAIALQQVLPVTLLLLALALGLALLIGRQLKRNLALLSYQARVDSLSKLPNRQWLREKIRKSVRNGENVVLGLLDLDGFKIINDNYGHQVGDRLIVEVANRLRSLAGDGVFVARLGGDEFALLARGEGASERTEQLAGEFLAWLSAPLRVDERTMNVGASIGLADNRRASNAVELLRRADVAMYAAKQNGKMCSVWFTREIDAAQARRHVMENRLRDALANDEFQVRYQPLMSSSHDQIVGVEALARWHTNGIEIEPADFIPVAEETGLIDAIGLVVLRKACLDGLAWNDMCVAVNISAAQLRNPTLPARIGNVLKETGFPASRLDLEVTETYLVGDPVVASKVIKELRALGVRVSLDDFGTGYASIGFLRQFDFDRIKLDRSLVNDAQDDPSALALLQASVAVAHALGMRITAEGVETEAQESLMKVIGCDQLQGWLYAKAMHPDSITDLLGNAGMLPQRLAK